AVRHARVESLHAQRFDVIACRAFASLHVFVRETRRLLSEEGIWMAMKGKVPDTDLAWLINLTFHVEPLEVPGLTGDRCVVWLSQEASASLP
ncbi:MAG: RsmG family class I SAM-dependent methyltransferase, partial [Caldimonas sp.]